MCCENDKRFFALFLFALLLCLSAAAPRAEERWFLISETELRSIELYKQASATERRSWLSQVRGLSEDSRRLSAESTRLREESESLNSQLSAQRELNRQLERSFNELEADRLTMLSSLGGENAALRTELATSRGRANARLVIIVGLAAGIAVYAGFRLRTAILRR